MYWICAIVKTFLIDPILWLWGMAKRLEINWKMILDSPLGSILMIILTWVVIVLIPGFVPLAATFLTYSFAKNYVEDDHAEDQLWKKVFICNSVVMWIITVGTYAYEAWAGSIGFLTIARANIYSMISPAVTMGIILLVVLWKSCYPPVRRALLKNYEECKKD